MRSSDDVCFLSDRYLLTHGWFFTLGRMGTALHIRPCEPEDGYLEDAPTPCYSLHLPLGLRDPFGPPQLTTEAGPAIRPASLPFVHEPEDRILAVSVNQWTHRAAYPRLYISARALVAFVRALPRSASSQPIPWEEWGPRMSRLVVPERSGEPAQDFAGSLVHAPKICGMRAVCPEPVTRDGVRYAQVLDFHPHRVARARRGRRASAARVHHRERAGHPGGKLRLPPLAVLCEALLTAGCSVGRTTNRRG